MGIHGVEEHAGTVYLILEYVEGLTLADLLKRGPLPTADALELAVHIADGEGARDFSAFPDGKRLLLIRDKKPLKDGSVRVVKDWLADAAD